MAGDAHSLNRFSLAYDDPELEADYQSYQPSMLIRIIRPVLILLFPIFVGTALIDYFSLADVEALPWQSSLILVVSSAILLVLASIPAGRRFVQTILLITLVLFGCSLVIRVSSDADLIRYFPGYFIVMMMAHFIGVRFTYGIAAAGVLVGLLLGIVVINNIDAATVFELSVFLIPGYVISASAGYTMERQRRRLFAQVKEMEAERDFHERMALHDALTELPNRHLLRERMQQSLARSKRQHGQFAVLFVDLDDFKSVNDSYGHGIGDQVLKQIAVNLQHQVRGEDTVARLGGDEFVVLSEHVNDERGAQIAADRIQWAISKPIVVPMKHRSDTIHIHVTCSIGIALCPRDGDSLDQLIARADDAMYKAKRGGKSTSRFFRTTGQPTDGEPSPQ